jgi:mRNA interferase YafQ
MYEIETTSQFVKDYKRAFDRGYNLDLLEDVVDKLSKGERLHAKHKDHALKGKWVGRRECHITPDWLLVYKIEEDILILTLTRTGTHSDLF